MSTKDLSFTMTVNADTNESALQAWLGTCPHAHSVRAVSSALSQTKDESTVFGFKVGDVVIEIGGAVDMTVSAIPAIPTDDVFMVTCQWFEGAELKEAQFDARKLTLAPAKAV